MLENVLDMIKTVNPKILMNVTGIITKNNIPKKFLKINKKEEKPFF